MKGASPSSSAGKRILVWPFRAMDQTLLPEALLADSLRLRGHEVRLFFCDGFIDACDHMMFGDDQPTACATCQRVARACRANTRVPAYTGQDRVGTTQREEIETLAQTLPVDEIFAYVIEGVNVGQIVRSSVLRFLLKGELDPIADEAVIRHYFRSALMITAAVGSVIDTFKPDRLLVSHGIYVNWGIVSELCSRRGIPIVVWGFGYRKDTVLFVHGDTYHRILPTEPNDLWEGRALGPDEDRELTAYLDSKRTGARDDISYYWDLQEGDDQLGADLRFDEGRTTVGLFTNLTWDAALVAGPGVFTGIFDWVSETVRHLFDRRDINLIIRVHPAEVKSQHESRQKVADELYARFGELPPHMKVIRPESKISSYRIGDLVDVAIVFGTKFGLELAVRGIPVIVAGNPIYRNKGFTIDVESKEEYLALLDRLPSIGQMSSKQVELAKRYAYHYLFRAHKELRVFHRRDAKLAKSVLSRVIHPPITLNFRSWVEIAPGANPTLDFICERIIDGKPFAIDPTDLAANARAVSGK